jgi:hypothetical protein
LPVGGGSTLGASNATPTPAVVPASTLQTLGVDSLLGSSTAPTQSAAGPQPYCGQGSPLLSLAMTERPVPGDPCYTAPTFSLVP